MKQQNRINSEFCNTLYILPEHRVQPLQDRLPISFQAVCDSLNSKSIKTLPAPAQPIEARCLTSFSQFVDAKESKRAFQMILHYDAL